MMWLSRKLRREMENAASADLGVTTIGGSAAGVYARGERRDLRICTPAGIAWQPRQGDRAVVLKGGNGGEEVYLLGVQESAPKQLADGELCLYSGGASICLRRDGRIELQGQVLINGTAYSPCSCALTGGTEEGGA